MGIIVKWPIRVLKRLICPFLARLIELWGDGVVFGLLAGAEASTCQAGGSGHPWCAQGQS